MGEQPFLKSTSSSDIPSPVFLRRRRLSAPETIMRRHALAQQRSCSQESEVPRNIWRLGAGVGSDPNLNRKRDNGLMRKSTLLRRLWDSNKPLSERSSRVSSSYYEWQYYGKVSKEISTQSLSSTHSSPEHLKYRTRSLNDNGIMASRAGNSKVGSLENNVIRCKSISSSSSRSIPEIEYKKEIKSNISEDNKITNRTTFSNPNIISSIDNPMSSRKTSFEITPFRCSSSSTEAATTTTFSDNNCDSAYTNNNSSFTNTSNDYSTICSTFSSERFIEGNGNYLENADQNDFRKIDDQITNTVLETVNDCATQTDVTNVNVISNVELSQSTLNLIYDRVMQDFKKHPTNNINISSIGTQIVTKNNSEVRTDTSNVIQVRQLPNAVFKQKEEQIGKVDIHCNDKRMVSNIGTGSPYSKPSEVPHVVVPRYSAEPRSVSMEVNTSSGESSDKEGDTASLVDSLEDASSPRIDYRSREKLKYRDCTNRLPNSIKDTLYSNVEKSSTFFIPINNTNETALKSVADHLPKNVLHKLRTRQIQREQRLKDAHSNTASPKSDSNYVSASDNGNLSYYCISTCNGKHNNPGMLPELNMIKDRRKITKSITEVDRMKNVKHRRMRETEKTQKLKKRSSLRTKGNLENSERKTILLPKPSCKQLEQLIPLNKRGSNEHIASEVNNDLKVGTFKRIDNIETCSTMITNNRSKFVKSKIPVLVNSKLPFIPKKFRNEKPILIELDQCQQDETKVDQLIANILIDALNRNDVQTFPDNKIKVSSNTSYMDERKFPIISQTPIRLLSSRYHQMFDAIPEERITSLRSSFEDASSNSNDNAQAKNGNENKVREAMTNQRSGIRNRYDDTQSATNVIGKNKGRDAVGIVKGDDVSTIPKGWMTFYTLHKSQESPESTSDEGTRNAMNNSNANSKILFEECSENRKDQTENSHKYKENVNKIIQSKTDCSIPKQNVSEAHDICKTYSTDSNASEDSIHCVTRENQNKSSSLNSISSTDSLYKKHHAQNNKQQYEKQNSRTPNRWTVTVSGCTTDGQSAPDVQMRLTFPKNNNRDTQLNTFDMDDRSKRFPNITNQTNNVKCSAAPKTPYSDQRLPHIIQHPTGKIHGRNCESSVAQHLKNSKTTPRQTLTSSQRLLMNRPRTFMVPADSIDINGMSRDIKAILETFPELLKITGNAISPERKPRVHTTNEKQGIHRNSQI